MTASPHRDFRQIVWNEALEADVRALVELALREDLGTAGDVTSRALIPRTAHGRASIVARQSGVVAGLPAAQWVARIIDPLVVWQPLAGDGQAVEAGTVLAQLDGGAGSLLAAERLMLNMASRLSGVATLTRRYVDAVAGTGARLYDTRKTTPGWRLLEKYAVRCGGGHNHRLGLYDAVLIKDNHLAFGRGQLQQSPGRPGGYTPAQAVARARDYLAREERPEGIVEIEVDTLDELASVLQAAPDIVLLDNMPPERLREAVAIRNRVAPDVELEASGGVNLDTVRAIAESGVDRISVGALTHSAIGLDLALDWD